MYYLLDAANGATLLLLKSISSRQPLKPRKLNPLTKRIQEKSGHFSHKKYLLEDVELIKM